MGRLRPEFVERSEELANRVVKLGVSLASARRPSRIVDQVIGSGGSVGANVAEANEAMSRADFRKSLGIVAKELAETRFWMRLVVKQGWMKEERVTELQSECMQLQKIVGTILKNTRPGT